MAAGLVQVLEGLNLGDTVKPAASEGFSLGPAGALGLVSLAFYLGYRTGQGRGRETLAGLGRAALKRRRGARR